MTDKVQFELVSPEKLLLSADVVMVVIPGGEGNFGVLPGHSLLISTVRPGRDRRLCRQGRLGAHLRLGRLLPR